MDVCDLLVDINRLLFRPICFCLPFVWPSCLFDSLIRVWFSELVGLSFASADYQFDLLSTLDFICSSRIRSCAILVSIIGIVWLVWARFFSAI